MIIGVEDNYAPKDKVFRVEWNLGKRCNFDCSYCSPSIHDKKSEHIDLELFKKTSRKLVEHSKQLNKKIKVSLTGGEPYLHPKFIDMITYLKKIGFYRVSVTSNASVPLSLYSKSLQYVDYLILSLHFEFIKVDKIVEKIIKIKKACTNGQGFHVHLMALPGKTHYLERIKLQLAQNNISYVVRRIRPQFDREGLYNMPFTSGQEGDHKPNYDLIKKKNMTYYSRADLNYLGVIK